jgi:hypothetical protein
MQLMAKDICSHRWVGFPEDAMRIKNDFHAVLEGVYSGRSSEPLA